MYGLAGSMGYTWYGLGGSLLYLVPLWVRSHPMSMIVIISECRPCHGTRLCVQGRVPRTIPCIVPVSGVLRYPLKRSQKWSKYGHRQKRAILAEPKSAVDPISTVHMVRQRNANGKLQCSSPTRLLWLCICFTLAGVTHWCSPENARSKIYVQVWHSPCTSVDSKTSGIRPEQHEPRKFRTLNPIT